MRDQNNITVLRLAAALTVLITHCWPLALGDGALDPASAAIVKVSPFAQPLAGLAVNIFFVLSGFLITKSMMAGRDLVRYGVSRALRIYPALLVNILLTAFIAGPLLTTMPLQEYFQSNLLWKYVENNLPMWNAVYHLPGVYTDHPHDAVNGSLWTLPLEIRCYVAVGVLFAFGALSSRARFNILFASALALEALWPNNPLFPDQLASAVNILYFGLGAAFYVNRDALPQSLWIGPAMLVAAQAPFMPLSDFLAALGLSHLVLWLALSTPRAPFNEDRFGDVSYGVYIYAFPIQQAVLHAAPELSPLALAALATPLTLAAGALSWRWVEKRALAQKKALGNGLKTRTKRVYERFVRRATRP